MTDAEGSNHDHEDEGPEVDAELIKDLDVAEDADRIAGGLACSFTSNRPS
jgi:hypothetical protein